MEFFDIGIHAIIASFLDKDDLESYISTYNSDQIIFWILLIRERFPEYYRPEIKGLEWKEIYYGLLLYTDYDKYNALYKEFTDATSRFKETYPDIAKSIRANFRKNRRPYNEVLIETKEFQNMFPNIKSVPVSLIMTSNKWREMVSKYIEASKYLIFNNLIKLHSEDIKYISTYSHDYEIIKYILYNYPFNVTLTSNGFKTAMDFNDIPTAKLIYDYLSTSNSKEALAMYFDDIIKSIISGNSGISIESFNFMWNIIHMKYKDILFDILFWIHPDNEKLIEYIVSQIPENIDKDILMKGLRDNQDIETIFYHLMKKFDHRLTDPEKHELKQ